MKIRFLALALVLCLTPRVCGDLMVLQTLEDLQDKTPSGKEQITLYISGKKVRFDQGQRMSSIILMDRKVTYSVDHGMRKYAVLPHDRVPLGDAAGKKGATTGDGALDSLKIEATGKSEKISGFKCNQVFVTEKDGSRSELWIAPDALDLKVFLAEFNRFQEFGLAQTLKELEKRPELRGIPLRVIEYNQAAMARRATINRLETKPIPESVFEIPAGYAEVKFTDGEGVPNDAPGKAPGKPMR